ncbi:flagellar basal body rod protein FlgC [Candidatus Magnetoovum chiemensis]|nr:flagellar basal body rod protein FlgC [Candidatus Magnetoovum chiemensis]
MSVFGVFNVSASAMVAQRQRMNILSSNLANAQTTRTAEGGPYKRQDVVFQSTMLESGQETNLYNGVSITEVTQDQNPPTMLYNPNHPDADQDGYVAMPNINTIEEMTNMMMAVRSYEANVSAFNISKTLFLKTLEIGR